MKLTKQLKAELAKAYQCAMEISILDMKAPIRYINLYIAENVSGYGTAADEKVQSREDYRKMLMKSRQQAKGMLFKAKIITPYRPKFIDATTVQFHDEIIVQIGDKKNKHSIHLYMSCVYKHQFGKWQLVLFHGSMPDAASTTEDTFHLGEAEKKMKQLEQVVAQRTADLQMKTRELEIETSLERVRAVAMGMNKPDDMLDVCRMIAKQLKLLNVKEIRNVQTAIIYESKGTYQNFEYYAKHDKLLSTEVDFKNHPIQRKFANQMLKGAGELFTESIKGAALKKWYAYQKTTNQFVDKYLETTTSLNYYWFSLGPVALGISTYVPLKEIEVELFKRFRNVFELAYKRFLDIEQAIAQAKEAKLEASLEKVRAQVLSMKKPEDLTGICEVLFTELNTLGFGEIRNAMINIHDDEKRSFINYDYSDEIGKTINHLTYNIHPLIEKQLKQIRSANGFSETSFAGKDLKDWKAFRKKIGEKDDPRIRNIDALHYYFYSIGTGSIGISTFSSIGEEKLTVLKRFRNVFDFAYRRYMDVAQAEAQAREAQIELALERVRARTMAMQHSEELAETVAVMFEQFRTLGEEPERMAIEIVNETENVFEIWATQHGGSQLNLLLKASLDEPHVMQKMYTAWKAKTKSITIDLQGNELEEYFIFLKKAGLPVQRKIFGKRRVQNVATFSKGILTIITPEPRPQETIDLLERFANVLEQTYTRFLDLQKAEAQAREAQIELGLERVRARAMAMQKSDELSELVDTAFKELTKLDFALNWCIINIIDAPSLTNMVWAANPETNKPPESYLMKFEDFPFHHSMMKGYQERKTKHVYVLEGKEKKIYDDYLFNKTEWRRVPQAAQEASRAMKRYVATFTFSNFGGLQTVGEEYLSEENLDILSRFGKVFDLTYTRFNDLQKAEAQARDAQIEAALERVRSRSMAMHKSDELLEAGELLFAEMQKLGIESLTAGYVLIDREEKNGLNYTPNPSTKKIMPLPIIIPHNETIHMQQVVENWKKGKPFFIAEMDEDETIQHQTFIAERSTNFPLTTAQLIAISPEKLFLHNFYFKEGYVLIVGGAKLSVEQTDIMLRFTNVFQQTYTRFLDLQKAEAQAKEAQIEAALERVRSRSMGMQKSEELKEVIKIVYQQLSHLKINLDHAGFVVDYTPRGDWHFWIADEQDIPSKITHPYFESVWAKQFNEAKEKGEDFFATHLNFEEKNKFYKELLSYVPGLPEASRDFYLNCPGLAASTVLLDNVGLYIENFSGTPYTVDENTTLMRFGKVFQQTYTRFLDLQKAEANAREAQIEAALEKIRSRSLAMHKSEEIAELVFIFFEKMTELGVTSDGVNINIINEETKGFDSWLAAPGGSYAIAFHVPYFKHRVMDDIFEAFESKQESVARVYSYEDKTSFFTHLYNNTNFSVLPEKRKQQVLQSKNWEISVAFSKNIALNLHSYSGKIFTQSENDILKRFAKVFEQSYTRFLDLQKAEAQAKEAQIEGALEKVRSRTMAMQSSNELQETAAVLFQEFKKLGTDNIYQVTIGIYNEEERFIDFRTTSWANNGVYENRSFNLDMNEPTVMQPAVAAWKANKKSLVIDLSGEKLERWLNYRNKMSGVTVSSNDTEGRRVITAAYYSKGHLSISTPVPVPAETVRTLERFAAVFDTTYTRFLDLQKAEAQARESQIEAALERVRSRTLAMQKSDELSETAAEVFRQLIGLGIEPNRLYIGIVKEETGDMEMWATDEDGTQVGKKFMFNKNENASVKKLFDGWKAKAKSVIVDMQGKELEDYFHYLKNVMHIPFKGGLTQKRRVQSVAYFSKGFIGMASPDGQGDETIQLLERFAAVFNLTFTRFNDLKIAEAHAEQAELDLIAIKEAKQKAEEALLELQITQKQLIQSEKMASLGELTAGIAHEIQNPLNFVNNFSEVSKELLDEMREAMANGNTDEAREIMNDVIQNLEKINHHGKRADGIVKGMLQHSRSSSGQKEPTDINALTDEYLRLAYHGLRAKDKSFNATLKTDYDQSVGVVNVLSQDMGRVILNLITNAFYVVGEKKKQQISDYEPTVSVSTRKTNDVIEIKVKDNGSGIPQKVLDKIFQPFFTTKPTGQGTGLGLSLAYDIVKAHGGELKVETKEGEGSTFIIQIPYHNA